MARIFDGTNYSDTIYGSNGADDIYGYAGGDDLYGLGGNDYLAGGLGDDNLYGGSGSDVLIGGTGANDLWGGSGRDFFVMSERDWSGFSDDLVKDFTLNVDRVDLTDWGVSDFSQVTALLGADSYGDATINAYYAGYDHVLTLDGIAPGQLLAKDFIYADPSALNETGTGYDDVLFGSRFADVLRGGGGNDNVLGGLGNDTLSGGGGTDLVVGGAGSDSLYGGTGSDLLRGDAGADLLVGGTGRDFMEGGTGADLFRFGRYDFSGSTPDTADTITDFTPTEGDRIDLSAIDARVGGADNAFTFIGTADFSGIAGQLQYQFAGGDTLVTGDTNGDRIADFMIVLSGEQTLYASDFYL
jgi:Ca2+-binding RTX toxin-like protein